MFSPLLKNEPMLKMLSKNGNVLAKRYFNKFHKKPLEGVILNSSFNKDSTTVSFIAHENNRSSTDKPYTVCFNNIFLRDSSRSPGSVDVGSGQKLFTTGELATDSIHTTPELVEITSDGKFLTIKWKDGDVYDYPLEFLYKYKGSTFVTRSLRNRHTSHRPTLWDTMIFNDHLKTFAMDYDEFLHDDKRFYDALINLQKIGMVMIKNLPKIDKSVDPLRLLCNRIGPVRSTIYGEIFEVNNLKPNDSNITFSNKKLPFHQDLTYLENIPGFQLLHVVKNETDGGENLYVDAFNSTRHIRETDIEAYEALNIVPINYQYKKDDKRYYQSKPLIEQYDSNEHNVEIGNYEYLIKTINYSPPYQAPLTYGIYNKAPNREVSTAPGKVIERFLFRDFIRGLKLFEQSINNPVNQIEISMPEDTCIIFNNRRILHARNEIISKPNSQRLFRGCFISNDHFMSKLTYFEEKFGS
ncbi:uncharacterized protein PWA37_000638 [Arxiozyma heterogenica]|uniref:uncharacterized protein n=1 Tax=Arxiozyma heterogenica TaxID=278026 RepID=UPI002EF96D1C